VFPPPSTGEDPSVNRPAIASEVAGGALDFDHRLSVSTPSHGLRRANATTRDQRGEPATGLI
jgi:hypothetical protein